MKYSPAPWSETETSDGIAIVRMDADHMVEIGDLEDTCDICHANSHLISAAPELLEACLLLMEQYDSSDDFVMGGNLTNKPFLMARSAIAKAKGEA